MNDPLTFSTDNYTKFCINEKAKLFMTMIDVLNTMIKHTGTTKEEIEIFFKSIEETYYELVDLFQGDIHSESEMFNRLNDNIDKKISYLQTKITHISNPFYAIQEQVSFVYRKISEFWAEQGFYFIDDMRINSNGVIELNYGFSCDYKYFMDSQTNPVSSVKSLKDNIDQLKAKGFIFCDNDKDLLDCDKNKSLIYDILITKYPSIKISSWESFISYSHKTKEYQQKIKKLFVRIIDLNDINNQ